MTTFPKPLPKPLPIEVASGTELLGEIICWTCNGLAVRHTDLIASLKDAGLDEGVARELAPRHAFARACRKLSDARIIRQVAENETSIEFQFTSESRDGDRFSYDFETLLTLDKRTGAVTCDLPGLATLAQEELDRCIAVRTGSDVTRIVQKLFERTSDLFPIRPQGGAYFTPAAHAGFVDKVQTFLGSLNGAMLRFPIPKGTDHGDRSVKEAVASGLSSLIAEHAAAVEVFGADTRPDTIERAAARIKATQFKIQVYAEYLQDQKAKLDRELAAAQQRLRARVAEIAGTVCVA